MMKIQSIDHIVLTVRDLDITCKFYTEVLGMKEVVFGKGRRALLFGSQKINLHEKGKEFEPKAKYPTCGSIDICLISITPIKEVERELRKKGIDIIEGIVERTGAMGKIQSIYINDPDGNLIEVANSAVD